MVASAFLKGKTIVINVYDLRVEISWAQKKTLCYPLGVHSAYLEGVSISMSGMSVFFFFNQRHFEFRLIICGTLEGMFFIK